MRKKAKNKTISFKTIIIIFIVVLCSISIGYSLLYKRLSIVGKGELVISDDPTKTGIEFTYNLEPWYNGKVFYWNCNGKLTNLTTDTVENWKLIIDVPEDVTEIQCWSVKCSVSNGKAIFEGSDSTDLAANASISFGFQLSSSLTGEWEPNNYTVTGTNTPTPSPSPTTSPSPSPTPTPTPTTSPTPDPGTNEDIVVAVKLGDPWQSGDYYVRDCSYTITNNSDTAISSWKFKMSVPDGTSIVAAWDMNYVEADGYIIFSNGQWNGSVDVGKTVSLNFQLKSKEKDFTPTVSEITTT